MALDLEEEARIDLQTQRFKGGTLLAFLSSVMRRRSSTTHVPADETPEEALCRRARRCRRRGDDRRAWLLLREAAHENEGTPKLWIFYGMQCGRMGKVGAAQQAFRHAAWLHERARHRAKAEVTRSLFELFYGRHAA